MAAVAGMTYLDERVDSESGCVVPSFRIRHDLATHCVLRDKNAETHIVWRRWARSGAWGLHTGLERLNTAFPPARSVVSERSMRMRTRPT